MTTSPATRAAIEAAVETRSCGCSHQAADDVQGAAGLSRRHVLAGLGAIGAAATLAACGPPAPSGSTTKTAEPVVDGPPGAIARAADVPVGGAVAADLDGTPVIITQPEEGTFVGLSAICTHQGCAVAPDGGELSCPCHGSTFSLAGEVGQGPATENLPTFDVTIDRDFLVAGLGS